MVLCLDTFEIADPETGELRLLKTYEKTIARAMQDYGMVDYDNGGGIELYGVHEISYGADSPYDDIFPSGEEYVYLPTEWISHLRVLELVETANDPEVSLTAKQWSHYTCGGYFCAPEADEICSN